MALDHQCTRCGRRIGYEGLCWICKEEAERQQVLDWTDAEIEEKIRHLISHAEKLNDWKTEEYKTACKLIDLRGVWRPELQRAALAADAFALHKLYYHAPSDVRDGLIEKLEHTEDAGTASRLMQCLAMQGDDAALSCLHELERHPKPWRKKLYVDPSVYAQVGGWTFDSDGKRRMLNFEQCYPLVSRSSVLKTSDEAAENSGAGETGSGAEQMQTDEDAEPCGKRSPVHIAYPRKDNCPVCGGRMMDMLTVDGRDGRLAFLGVDGIVTAACCPNCIVFMEHSFSRYTPDGQSTPIPYTLPVGEDFIGEEGRELLARNDYVLADQPVPPFFETESDYVNTIGGFASWVQEAQYVKCPDCGKPMKYLAQIHWMLLNDSYEGTLYVEFCPDCQVASIHHQQT